jgi:preprotein translocase subunit YajC
MTKHKPSIIITLLCILMICHAIKAQQKKQVSHQQVWQALKVCIAALNLK